MYDSQPNPPHGAPVLGVGERDGGRRIGDRRRLGSPSSRRRRWSARSRRRSRPPRRPGRRHGDGVEQLPLWLRQLPVPAVAGGLQRERRRGAAERERAQHGEDEKSGTTRPHGHPSCNAGRGDQRHAQLLVPGPTSAHCYKCSTHKDADCRGPHRHAPRGRRMLVASAGPPGSEPARRRDLARPDSSCWLLHRRRADCVTSCSPGSRSRSPSSRACRRRSARTPGAGSGSRGSRRAPIRPPRAAA